MHWVTVIFALDMVEGVHPCRGTSRILGAQSHQVELFSLDCQPFHYVSVNMSVGWIKSNSPSSAPSATKTVSCSFLDSREEWEQAGAR